MTTPKPKLVPCNMRRIPSNKVILSLANVRRVRKARRRHGDGVSR